MGALGVPPPVLISLAQTEWKSETTKNDGNITLDTARPDRAKESKYKDYSRLPAVHHSLGDYTQWVHLACPHRF